MTVRWETTWDPLSFAFSKSSCCFSHNLLNEFQENIHILISQENTCDSSPVSVLTDSIGKSYTLHLSQKTGRRATQYICTALFFEINNEKVALLQVLLHAWNSLQNIIRFFGTNQLKVERWFQLLTWMEQCLTPDSVFFPAIGKEVELSFPLQQLRPFLSSAHTSPRWQCPFILTTSELAIICLQWVAATDQCFSVENTALNMEQSTRQCNLLTSC